MKKILGLIVLLIFTGTLFAQQKTHTVQAQETIYGISKQYGISQDDLIKANPFLKDRSLQIGDELNIPVKSDGSIKTVVTQTEAPEVYVPQEDKNFIYLEIKPKQTIYSITKEYKISEDALKSLNPQLKDGLKVGDVIRIPKKSTDEKEEIVPDGMYKVKKSDTVFSLSKSFGVSQEEFYIANPQVQTDGLIVDTYVKIPKKGKTQTVIQDGFIEHIVKQGETIYSISKLYKVSFDDLLKHNPELVDGLKTGMTLKIPLPEGSEITKIGGKIKRASDNEINIALILPFHLDDNEGKAAEKAIAKDFLIGARIALDSIAYKGKKINLKVFDSGNDSQTIENLIANNNFSQFDAVVGPLFGSNFKALAGILEGSGIAMISPLSNSDDLRSFENVLIVTPSDEAIADAIVNEIVGDYQGQEIQILTDDRYEKLAGYFSGELKKKLKASNISISKNISQINQSSKTTNETLSDGSLVERKDFNPLITVLVSDNNALGDSYVNKIKQMDTENLRAYGVKFVNAYDVYSTQNKANIAALKNIGFAFATNRFVNVYGQNERNTINKFINLYCEAPNEYRQLSFDIFYDLADRMNNKGDILNNLGGENSRLSTKFKYEKSGKSYANTAVRLVRLFTPADESPDDVDE